MTTAAATRPQIARRLFTVAEYLAMGEAGILHEDERVELLAGEIIQMAAIGNRHLFCTDALTMLFAPALVGRAIVRVQGSIQLDEYGMPEPDIVLLRLRPDYYDETATPADVLLLIEVADSSAGIRLWPEVIVLCRCRHPGILDSQSAHRRSRGPYRSGGNRVHHRPHDSRGWRHYLTGISRRDPATARVYAPGDAVAAAVKTCLAPPSAVGIQSALTREQRSERALGA